MYKPKISIVVPFHWMDNWEYFLNLCLKSIEMQTFKDYEVVLIKHSNMPITSNRVIESAKGELIKILYMDDRFSHEDSLKEIIDNFKDQDNWLVTGCVHDNIKSVGNPHYPKYTDDISTGNNGIGSPSVLTIRNEGHLLFDERLSWLLDCDLYKRYYDKYGEPRILPDLNVVIGQHKGQMTHKLTNEEKLSEHNYLLDKFK